MNTCYKGGNGTISPTPLSDTDFNKRLEIFRDIPIQLYLYVKLDVL